MLATSVGGRNTTAATEKILMMPACSMLMRPKHGIEQEADLARQERRMIGQRNDVALQDLEPGAMVLDLARLLSSCRAPPS